MAIRSFALLSIVATAFSFAASAHADVPNPTTGSGTTTTTTSSATTGAGGAGTTGVNDPDCTVAAEEIAGTTCQACDPTTSACTSLGSDYNFVCQNSATVAVWCNGPARTTPSDQNAACAVAVPGGAWSGMAAVGALAAAAVLSLAPPSQGLTRRGRAQPRLRRSSRSCSTARASKSSSSCAPGREGRPAFLVGRSASSPRRRPRAPSRPRATPPGRRALPPSRGRSPRRRSTAASRAAAPPRSS